MNYDYDVFGNRYQWQASNQNNPFGQIWVEDGAFNSSTNRFAANVSYDDAGNILTDQKFRQLKFQYDANNRQKQSSNLDDTGAVVSVFDAGGQRVATQVNGSLTNVLVYDAGGKLVAEYGSSAASGGTQYLFSDHQGSTRAVTNSSGAVISRHDYLPFGEELNAGVGLRSANQGYSAGDNTRQKYAGMETDDATGMAHTLWRQYDSSSGRWTSPDPYTASMTIANPQSFNRYSYVQNDPVNMRDPSGLMTKEGQPDPDTAAAKDEPPGDPFETGRSITAEAEARYDRAVAATIEDNKTASEAKSQHAPPGDGNGGDSGSGHGDDGNAGGDSATATVDLMRSDLGVPQEPAPQGTLTIRDNIRERRAVDVDPQCGNTNAGACTHATALTVSFSTNDGANWRARNVDLRIFGTMWITSAPFPYKGRRPLDRSVVDARTARAHEYNSHINVAIAAVTPVINEFLGRTFRSEREFQAAADQLSIRVSDLFRRTLRDTQDRENNRR